MTRKNKNNKKASKITAGSRNEPVDTEKPSNDDATSKQDIVNPNPDKQTSFDNPNPSKEAVVEDNKIEHPAVTDRSISTDEQIQDSVATEVNSSSTLAQTNVDKSASKSEALLSEKPDAQTSAPDSPISNSAPSDNASKTMTTATDTKNKQSKSIWFGLLIVTALAVVAFFYLWQHGQQQQLALQSDIKAALQGYYQQPKRTQQLQRQIDRVVAAAALQQTQNTESMRLVKKQLQSQQQRLQSLSTTDRDDWLLAEAEYLIRLANQRLLMGKEIVGALDLLNAADAIAHELDDTALFAVREALAKDMAALRQAAKLDVEGVYLKLAALATQADQLRLFTLPTLTVAAVENNYQQQTWRERLDTGLVAAWQKLKGYIQVRRRDEIYKPLLAPEYEAAVRQNVRLMFEQSQMAVLAGKQNLYIDSLNKASQWLNDYYTIDNEKTALLTAQIDEIKALQIVAELPDISASLRALKNYVELIHDVKQPLSNKAPQASTAVIEKEIDDTTKQVDEPQGVEQ